MARAFSLTIDLFENLEEMDLAKDLPELPSNSLSGQVWCIVGARESYFLAIQKGSWSGFSCSLNNPGLKPLVLDCLMASADKILGLDFEKMNDPQVELAFDLLEHEIQHHGQLIRYIYGNRLNFPENWKTRYHI
ncbi:MAG: hypothetical protein ACOYXC_16545 [Candidatus Rifleibacteriota bacterium]